MVDFMHLTNSHFFLMSRKLMVDFSPCETGVHTNPSALLLLAGHFP